MHAFADWLEQARQVLAHAIVAVGDGEITFIAPGLVVMVRSVGTHLDLDTESGSLGSLSAS